MRDVGGIPSLATNPDDGSFAGGEEAQESQDGTPPQDGPGQHLEDSSNADAVSGSLNVVGGSSEGNTQELS